MDKNKITKSLAVFASVLLIIIIGVASFANIETGNAGMYSYTEGTGKTYYYRGAVDNNWVKYGKFKEDQIVYRGYFDENSTDEIWYDGNSSPKYIDYPTLAECQT